MEYRDVWEKQREDGEWTGSVEEEESQHKQTIANMLK